MANPNIVNVTNIAAGTAAGEAPTGLTSVLTAASNTVIKVNSIIIANKDGTNDADISVAFYNGSARYLARLITVPASATLVVISKDTALYLTEGTSIQVQSSVSGDLDYVISYETIS